MIVTLYLTRDCNLNCSYCYAGTKRRERMSFATAEAAVRIAMEHSRSTVGIRFFGGEPLLEWDLLQEIVQFARPLAAAHGLRPTFSLNTNGHLLDDRRLKYLESEDVGVGISLDGTPAVHNRNRRTRGDEDTFDDSVRGYRLARHYDLRLAVELVLDASNVREFAGSVRHLVDEIGVRFLIVSVNIFAPWTTADVAVLTEQYAAIAAFWAERFAAGEPFEIDALNNKINVLLRGGYDMCLICQLGQTDITVVPDGRIYPCLRLVGWDEAGTTVIGHINTGFDQEKVDLLYRLSKTKPTRCLGCENDGTCVNWCASTNLVLSGSLSDVGDFLCQYERIVIAECKRQMARINIEKYRRDYRRYFPSRVCEPASPHRL